MRRPTRRYWAVIAAVAAGLTTPGCEPAAPRATAPTAAAPQEPDLARQKAGERAVGDAASQAA